MSAVKPKGKKPKNGVMLATIMIFLYAVVLLGTLKYTGVIKFPNNKKTNVAKEKTDMKNKGRSPAKAVKAAENKTGTTTTTTPVTITTTTYTTPDANQLAGQGTQSDQDLKRLVKVYESMDSDQAAKIIAELSDSNAIALLSKMKTQNVAEILAAMDVQRAASLSKKLGIPAQ